MTDQPTYTPPKVWTWNEGDGNGGQFAGTNRPTAGAQQEKELLVGRHPFQLYSLATPNGVKVTVMLEELLEAGRKGAEYDAWLIDIRKGDQFGSGFVAVNPNSKIPALVDRSGREPIHIFESGAILMHLAEKFEAFLPTEAAGRARCLSWLFWQMGSAPYLGGGFGHFYAYAPIKIEYAIDRYAMEAKRQLDVLDKRLAEPRATSRARTTRSPTSRTWPWYGQPRCSARCTAKRGGVPAACHEYANLQRWTAEIAARPGGAARPQGQRARSGELGGSAARAPRRERLRAAHARQARGGEIADAKRKASFSEPR